MAQSYSDTELTSLERSAVVFLGARWVLWIWAVFHAERGADAAVCLTGAVLVAISLGLYSRSRLLFALSIPVQIATYALYLSYCFSHVYIVNRGWEPYVLSLFHLALMWFIFLYDCYVSVVCTRIYHQQRKAASERRRSPNASFIDVFKHNMGSPHQLLETPRSRGSPDASIEEGVPASESFKELFSLTSRRLRMSSASSVDSAIFEAYLAVDAATLV